MTPVNLCTPRTSLIHHKIIPVPFRQPSTVFQPTAPPDRPTTSNLAPYHRVWPATDQPWPQLGVASRSRSFQMAFSCGDGYAHRWACHLMMMMMMMMYIARIHGFVAIILLLTVWVYLRWRLYSQLKVIQCHWNSIETRIRFAISVQ